MSGFSELLAIQPTCLEALPEVASGYKPPRDIGRPRRTGPSGGRVV
ncbi:MAG: hypothetical protein NW224_17445 [Leptolyngbyaceae cyanobacterium bins.302]|nr:hypothetical protein [Leptolyngbyaceae cyanobacterium bins.302]